MAKRINSLFINLFFLVSLCVPLVTSASVKLINTDWQIELIPETLAIVVTKTGQQPVTISRGGDQHGVEKLTSDQQQASWDWDKGLYRVSVALSGRDLLLTVQAKQAGQLTLVNQPASALGKGLLLPIAEGHYIPSNNPLWRDFLLSELATINTTQDLSLPLWGMDYGDSSLHWLLLNPFNNQLQFSAENDKSFTLSLSHQFIQLETAPPAPMQMVLHLADTDLLAGAKRYRQWLIEQNKFEPLQDKIAHIEGAKKLIGATQVYLWGNDLLAVKDVRDWRGLIAKLKIENKFITQLRSHFDKEAQQLLALAPAHPDRYQKKVIITAINDGLKALARQAWQTEQPDMQQLTSRYAELRQEVAKQFTGVLTAEPSHWGSGLSIATMEKLQAAGLERLWIGLGDGWEGGLWLPEAVSAGVNAGYLVAPYDSYQTALPVGVNPDWTTAHLGQFAYQQCTIMQADGSLKAGFQKSGHYTDPRCIEPLLKQRISAIQQRAGFNSWFLDAYTTGMLFDSYNKQHPMTQAQNAQANAQNIAWVSNTLAMPVGSEDGNATTAQKIVFAHGMQTPVIGWGDPELTQPNSPYYLGRWYPNDQPSLFFKAAKLKEPYRTVYFDPRYRLPLYQSVFHDSVITSHHWLFDNLKLSNVAIENQLTQLLYNVAPMFHLSAASLETRLPELVKQDRFFRPLHQQLAAQALTQFVWLTDDHLVQQTTFLDGSSLVANFSDKAKQVLGLELPAYSVTALLVGQSQPQIYHAVEKK